MNKLSNKNLSNEEGFKFNSSCLYYHNDLIVPLLRNIAIIKSHLAAQAGGYTAEHFGEEDDKYTIINKEDPEGTDWNPYINNSPGGNNEDIQNPIQKDEYLDHTPPSLKESIPVFAKAKITDVFMTKEVQKLLKLHYGNLQEIRTKLKEQVINFKLTANLLAFF